VEQRADGGADARSTTDGGGLKTLGRCLAVESTVARVQGFPRRWQDEEDDGKGRSMPVPATLFIRVSPQAPVADPSTVRSSLQ
jgi:hypothetical protein